MNVVTVACLAVLPKVTGIVPGTDACHAALVPVSDALDEKLELAFDHARILRDAVAPVRVDLELRGIATAFVGPTFTLAELRIVYEAVWGVQLDGANSDEAFLGRQLGQPDRTPSPPWSERREAGGALPRRSAVAAGRAHPLPAAAREARSR